MATSIDDQLLSPAYDLLYHLKRVDKRCQRSSILPETDRNFISCYERVYEKINELELYIEDLKENKDDIPKDEFKKVMNRIKYFISTSKKHLSKYTLLDDHI